MIRIPTLAIAALLARRSPPPVSAADRAALDRSVRRCAPNVTVTGDVVRIGDLVDNAGIAPRSRSSAPPISAPPASCRPTQVLEAVRAHAVIGVDTGGSAR